ncbi:sodium:solute symporter family protein [Rheinheimera sp.]|uniref:sodium:solute symporter family protein n=1 Tax=Rheinheimera sp. TaxID=1869214 RepID=UPI00307F012D
MTLHWFDLLVIALYMAGTLGLGFYIANKARQDMNAYFLGGKKIPWWALGVSNASGMFDIAGTMWLVTVCFIYGLKSVWLPWVWPIFNQVFLMVYLSLWLRRSNVMTGAEWLETRFGKGRGAELCQWVVVIFAIVSAIGFIAYAFKGIGKFAAIFFPWHWSPDTYALLIFAFTTLYVLKGGMYSVVLTELLQFVIMTLAAVAVGVIAMSLVSPEQIQQATPDGWDQLWFGWQLDLNWQGLLDAANDRIQSDGMDLFGLMIMMMLFKGVLFSMAGPVPNYDMQRILAAKTPTEAAKMSGLVSLVMFVPRYMMVAGFTVLALVYMGPEIKAQGQNFDFEQLLPIAISQYVPVGLAGLLIAGLLAAFMSTLAASVNAAPVYLVNDVYKKYFNPNAEAKTYVRLSTLMSLVLVVVGVALGYMLSSINNIMQWIFGALFGGYAAANLLKWHWWRFNAYGYFWGMMSGLVASMALPLVLPDTHPLYAFPAILALSLAGSVLGTLMTPAESMQVLCDFYRQVRPWGCWGPVKQQVLAEQPDFDPDTHPGRDAINILVGMVWQLALVALPIYLVIQQWPEFGWTLAVALLSSWFLKKNWLDKLKD